VLREYGLDLDALRSLSPLRQANQILKALIGSGGAVEEGELRAASARALRQLLVDNLSAADAIRVFVVEYVMEIYSSECGEAMRDGSRPGGDSAEAERQLRSVLRNRVVQIELSADTVTAEQLQATVDTALGTMRGVMGQ
jgi:hypothetical protein